MPSKPCFLIKWFALSVLVLLGAASSLALAQTTFGPTTGIAATGATLYAACTSCHGASGTSNIPIRNAANAGRVINLAMARGMGGFNAGSYNDTQENDLAAHIATFFSSPNPSGQAVTFNSLGTAISLPNIYLASAFGAFSGAVAVSAPARGSVSYNLMTATYTPFTGQCGSDSFSWRGEGQFDTPGGTMVLDTYQSSTRSSSVVIGNAAAPNISFSGGSIVGTYNTAIAAYTPSSTGGPVLSYSATGLPSGLSANVSSGVISGIPTQTGTFNATLTAFNCLNGNLTGQSSSKAITVTIAPAAQTISFAALASKLTTDAPFVVAATGGGSGNAVTFTASGVCSSGGTNGATISLTTAPGSCTVTASQAGNVNYFAAVSVMQSFTVVNGGGEVFPPNCMLPPGWTVPAGADGGWSVATDFTSSGACSLKSAVIPDSGMPAPSARIQFIGDFLAGNVSFTRRVSSENNYDCFRFLIDGTQQSVGGGCAFGGGIGASGEVAFGPVSVPITAGTHTITWVYEKDTICCAGGLDASWIDQVVMPLSTTVSGVTNAFGSVDAAFTSSVTATNFPLSYSASGLPPGLTINTSSGLISGTPTTAGNFTAMITASNPGGANPGASDLQSVGFLIFKGTQTITFAPINNKLTTLPLFVVGATGGPSGNPVIFTASGVCSTSGVNGATILLTATPGGCTVTASQAGNANYNDTGGVTQSFNVSTMASEIFPPACTMPLGWTIPGGATTGWSVSANEESTTGACSLKSMPMANTGTPLQADIQFVGNLSTGNITFKYRVSSENGYDCFQFLLDGVAQSVGGSCANASLVGASGEAGWTSVSIPVNGGLHQLVWRYDKDDVCCASGRDAAWIDDVVLPQFTLTVSKGGTGTGSVLSTPAGIDCGLGGPCSATLSGNVLLTPNPGFLSFFAGWSGSGCVGTSPCTVTLDASKFVSAIFSPAVPPGPPQNVVATPGNTQATFTFNPPASDGGSPITSYGVNCSATGQTTRLNSGNGSPLVVTAMVNGVQYSCTVGVSTFAGSTFAPPVLVTPRTVADAPTGIAAAPGNNQASVSFTPTPVLNNGGSAITSYTATCGLNSASGAGSPIVVSGLTNGTTVNCVVVANNAAGASAPSASVPVTPRTVPGAPTLPIVTAYDSRAIIAFTPPASDGGSAITGYTLSCNAGTFTMNGLGSPILATGLTNGLTYTCTVAANNAAGSTPSSSFAFIPAVKTGVVLYGEICASCHATPPAGTQLNAAGTSPTVINYVIANQPTMASAPLVTALTAAERAAIIAYIAANVPVAAETVAFNTPKSIDVSNRITIGGVAFESVQAGAIAPARGTLSAFTGSTVIYTPIPGYIGSDSFTIVGARTTPPAFVGSEVTININVLAPPLPVITSAISVSGANGVAFNYLITASNSPTSFATSGLPTGLLLNTMTGAVTGTPIVGGTFNVMISATNAGGTGSATLTINLNTANQTITFLPQLVLTRPYVAAPGNTFAINPLATASSTLTVTYSSLTAGMCTVAGSTVTIVAAGICRIAANQAGNVNFNAAAEVTQDVAITAIAPGAPTIGAATPGNLQASIAFTTPMDSGGSAITSYTATCSPSGTGSNTLSPIIVASLVNGTTYTCSVRANNVAGASPASATVTVTPTPTPTAPSIISANATTFTVTTAGTFNVIATGNPTPTTTLTGSLPSGVAFNAGVLAGTPALGTVGAYAVMLNAANGIMPNAAQAFTLNVAKAAQTISFTGPGSQIFTASTVPLSASSSASLAVSFVSNTPAVCTVAGANVTLVSIGTCNITAQQAGDANYNAATGVSQGFTVSQGGQTITFNAQASPRAYVTSGTFVLSPAASTSSGLAIAYTSLTSSVCAISGSTVSMLRAGQCTIAANQAGNGNVGAAAQVAQTIVITGSAPGAPTIGAASGGDGKAIINFTAPANDGGLTITSYTATCGGFTGSSNASPVTVNGLTNGVAVTCSVTATNALGTSSASATVSVTPNPLPGAAIWASSCASCHGVTPVGTRLNVGGASSAVLDYVIPRQATMNILLAGLSMADRVLVAEYVREFIPAVTASTPLNTAVNINVNGQIFINTPITAFTSLQLTSPPSSGILSAFTATTVTYTPNPGFVGTDSFTYHGTQAGLTGEPRTVTVTVAPGVPVVTSAATASGIIGVPFNYQIIATNAPTSYSASGLPGSLTINTGTGLISGTPLVSETINATVSATNTGGTGGSPLAITINLIAQTISFGAQVSPRDFSAGGSFMVVPLATGGASGNQVTYTSTTTSVCIVTATTVNMVTAGLCTIAANQAGNASYSAAAQVTQSVTINPVVPSAPTIGVATPADAQATVAFTGSTFNGGSAIAFYTLRCVGPNTVTASGGASPLTVTGMTNGASYACNVFAHNAAGDSADSATVNVTPSALPPLALATVVSRKTHGTAGDFDVAINSATLIGGSVDVEPRTIGGGHRMVFTFNNPITVAGSVTVVDSLGAAVGAATLTSAVNDVVVMLTGVADNKRVTVTLTNVNAVLTPFSVSLGFLVGDVNNTRSVNSSDISSVKARSGQTATGLNFKFDVNATGAINSSDISAVKARSGLTLPP